MKTFATVEEFEARHGGPLTGAERDQVRLLLEDTTALMLTHLGLRIVPHRHPQWYTLRLVCLQVAGRVWNNPGGITSEVIGDYSYRRDRGQATGLALTDGELRLLDYVLGGRPALLSVRFDSGVTQPDRDVWSPRRYGGLSGGYR